MISFKIVSIYVQFRGWYSILILLFFVRSEANQPYVFELIFNVLFRQKTENLIDWFFIGVILCNSCRCSFWLVWAILLLTQKLIYSGLEVDFRRMTCKVYFSPFVNKTDEGDSIDFEVFNNCMIVFPSKQSQVSDLLPLSTCNSLLDYFFVFIYTHTYYPHFVSPNCFILLEHFLVMFHGILTRSAPSCPYIDQQNLSLFVNKVSFPLVKDIVNLSVILEFSSRLSVGIKVSCNLIFS